MISKTIYNHISSQWEGEVFQNWERISKWLPLFEKNILPHFAGKRVLEIGCNAGIYAWHIAQVARSYIGIDISENYVRQALTTAKYIQGAPVRFLRTPLSHFAYNEAHFDAVFASFVLYHLSDAEIEIFEKIIARRCDVLAVQIRKKKREGSNSFNLSHAKNVERLFHRAGFDCRIYWENWWHTQFAAVGIRH